MITNKHARTHAPAHAYTHTNKLMDVCTHKDTSTSTHTKYIRNPALREGGQRETEEENQTGSCGYRQREQTDKSIYLFVHFNVEAIGHLIVLRRTEGQIFILVTSFFTFLHLKG